MFDQRALELAYRYLTRRERTVSELRRHLIGRDVDEASATAVIDQLTEEGYLDDSRFARLFTQDKRELEQWGEARISQALLARGVDRELVASALEAAARGEDGPAGGEGGELERALALLERRFPDPPRDRRERDRALGMLLRKGYAYDVAAGALREHRLEKSHSPTGTE